MRIYTTGEVSRICNVATTTVNKWFDTGRLSGFRVPGSRHRRIPQASLVKFLRDHGVPLTALGEPIETSVLLVTRDRDLVKRLENTLSPENGVQLTCTSSGFEAGIQAETSPPDCVIIDFDIGGVEANRMCQNIRRSTQLAEAIVVLLVPHGAELTADAKSVADDIFEKPIDPDLLAERTRTLTGQRTAAVRSSLT